MLHVTPPPGLDAPEHWPCRSEDVPGRAVAYLTTRHPGLRVAGFRLAGAAVPALGSQSGDAEMVVLGVRGEGGFAGLPVGSTALGVICSSGHPVVLVPSGLGGAGRGRRPDKVTVGVDARAPADGAVDFAFDTARRHHVRLHVLHAGAPPAGGSEAAGRVASAPQYADRAHVELELLTDFLRPWRQKYPGVRVLEDVALADPAQALIRSSGSAELMVVGRRRRRGARPRRPCSAAARPEPRRRRRVSSCRGGGT